ncbi:MAG: MnhB domain-containing protein [Thermomicrobiales bacterium]
MSGIPTNTTPAPGVRRVAPGTTVVTRSAIRILLIPTFLIAIATMLKGYGDTGDGFSAGVIAALGIAIQGVAFGADEFERLPLVRFAPAGSFVGLLLALTLAFLPVFWGYPVMTHFPLPGEHVVHFGTLELITAVLFDVSVFLVVFGFGVGVVTAIARAQRRLMRTRERDERRRQAARAQRPVHPAGQGGDA